MEGSVYDIAVFASTLYIGGDFKKINELPNNSSKKKLRPDFIKIEDFFLQLNHFR